MKLNDVYESNSGWLKADDIIGQKPVVTIESAEIKENTYDGETKKQIVLKFVGKDKCLGLNFTNASKIAELTETEDFSEWVGVTIKLMVEKVKFGTKMVDAIRVFPELPTQATAATGLGSKASVEDHPEFTGGAMPEADDSDSIPF